MITSYIKIIEDIPVAYIAKNGNPKDVAEKAFWELEQKVPLKGNKFYGVFDDKLNEYRACVAINEVNQKDIKGLNQGIIQGGTYAYSTLVGEYFENLRQIAPTLDNLMKNYQKDPTRPCVEFYKRQTEIIVMLPIILS